jgi:thiol peroxidase
VKEGKDMERKGVATAHGDPVTLIGPEIKTGQKAPGFSLLDQNLKEIRLSDYKGKIKIISVTSSLDTSICDLQLRRFNEEAGKLSGDIVILNVSVDLPFAIKRFCSAAGIEKAVVLSDHKDVSFGKNYGVLIKELRLLHRSVFVIDRDDVIRYVQIVPEMGMEPDYDAALKAAKYILREEKIGVGI